tara:strand:- start:1701 stop:3446 length:1746 start_codon:yes stop_codon:yes gene_type:complete
MAVETEIVKTSQTKEFETLLNEDFKRRDFKEGKIVKATVSEIARKYVFVDLQAKSEGSIPIEEFKFAKELDGLKIGSKIDVYLEKIESYKGEIVVSREKARRVGSLKKMQVAFETQKEVEGIITNKVKGGFIVNIDSCLCFLPGSQVDTRPVKNMDSLMNVPQKFLCVKLDNVRGNIVVSRKAVLAKSRDKELEGILSKIKEGDIISAQVKSILDWGAFLDVMGADALLHVTDLSYSRVNKPSDLLSIGDTIKCKVIKLDPKTKRISLGVKQLFPDPFENIEKRYEVGKIYDGVVSKVVDYGAFIKLVGKDGKVEEGLEGLCHQSTLSHTKKNIQPSKVLSSSQKVRVKILELDKTKRRISMSYKDTMENPWDAFIKNYPISSIVKGKIKNVAEFGVFVSIENSELTGLIHWKDISYTESEENLKKFKKNDPIKAKLLMLDREKETIRLGLRQLLEKDPFEFFLKKKNKEIITVTVREVLKNGIKVSVGNDKNLLLAIPKKHLSADPASCRPEIFQVGNRTDCMIVDLEKDKRKVNLSIKELEIHNEKIAIKKYGKDGTSSGRVLGDILGKVFKSKKKEKK